jgi:hypothetical protein
MVLCIVYYTLILVSPKAIKIYRVQMYLKMMNEHDDEEVKEGK